MPSPIAHAAMGFALYQVTRRAMKEGEEKPIVGPITGLMTVTVGMSLLPDMDLIAGVLTGDLGQFHNNVTHSLVFGLAVALVFGALAWAFNRRGFLRWFLIALLCYQTHIAMDFFTPGRGVMLLWPIMPDRYEPLFHLFYGVHWSEGVASVRHAWTVLTEAAFALLVIFVAQFQPPRASARNNLRA